MAKKKWKKKKGVKLFLASPLFFFFFFRPPSFHCLLFLLSLSDNSSYPPPLRQHRTSQDFSARRTPTKRLKKSVQAFSATCTRTAALLGTLIALRENSLPSSITISHRDAHRPLLDSTGSRGLKKESFDPTSLRAPAVPHLPMTSSQLPSPPPCP